MLKIGDLPLVRRQVLNRRNNNATFYISKKEKFLNDPGARSPISSPEGYVTASTSILFLCAIEHLKYKIKSVQNNQNTQMSNNEPLFILSQSDKHHSAARNTPSAAENTVFPNKCTISPCLSVKICPAILGSYCIKRPTHFQF